ncbi:MAG TPA: hypothetical protein VEC15_07975, partial [Actinomycetota bacterium]|nr:hypothetical protein [Actinomycetota bacterium]
MIATPTGISRHVASERRDGTFAGGRDRRVLLTFGVVLLTVAVARALVLASGDAPPGFDGGNWLAFGNAFLGRSVKAPSVVYPPLVPALSVAAAEALGPTAGLSVLAGVSSVLPAVGVFVVLSSAGLRAWAFALAILAAFVPSPGAIASWGGYPQLIATPFALIAYGALEAWLRTSARRALLVFGGAMLVVFATSHYVALVTAIALPVVTLATALDRTVRPQVFRRVAFAAGVAAAAAVPVMLVYARLIPAVLATRGRASSAAALQV